MNRSLPTLAIAALVIGGLAARGVVNGGAATATNRSTSRAPFDVVIADNMQRMMDDGRWIVAILDEESRTVETVWWDKRRSRRRNRRRR